ncbi:MULTISPECIES: HNH endonuclease [unclassified Aeromicrobium]|uniref:HNH endonuclease n=1 Tax=unclassified Aeromicrobium TaxID=2633570 RepID=UPI00288A8D9F|nr:MULTISPECIES: HNH endonuclease [unclassified Aeromicrobium]
MATRSFENTAAWKRARKATMERDGHRCVACGSEDDLTVDHIIPIIKGGEPTDESNLRTLCRPCNLRKGTNDVVRVNWTDPAWTHVFRS